MIVVFVVQAGERLDRGGNHVVGAVDAAEGLKCTMGQGSCIEPLITPPPPPTQIIRFAEFLASFSQRVERCFAYFQPLILNALASRYRAFTSE